MARHASTSIEVRPNGEVYAPIITPGWVEGHRLRREIQNPFLNRIFTRFFPDQRKHPRLLAPPMVAYLGSAGSSKPIPIVNVSIGGFCLRAEEFWTPGTVMPITLQKWNELPQENPEILTVQAMLVRREGDAAGFAIAVAAEESLLFSGFRVQRACNLQTQMADFLKGLGQPAAQAKVVPIDAATTKILTKMETMELLLEKAKNHKLSEGSGAWWGDEERDRAPMKHPW